MKTRFYFAVLFTCFLIVSCLAACSPQPGSPGDQSIPVPTVTRGAGEMTNNSASTPITAEEVVYAFLTAYENNPDQMVLFLSPEMQAALPEGDLISWLDFQGTLEGLVFTSGTTASDPNLAVVEARLQIDGREVVRTFYLERREESWLITGMDK